MGVVGAAIKGFGKALKVGKRNKASEQVFKNPKYKPSQKALKEATGWGAHLKRRSRVFKEGQERHKALDKQIKSGVVDRNVKSKEVFKIIKGLKK